MRTAWGLYLVILFFLMWPFIWLLVKLQPHNVDDFVVKAMEKR